MITRLDELERLKRAMAIAAEEAYAVWDPSEPIVLTPREIERKGWRARSREASARRRCRVRTLTKQHRSEVYHRARDII